MSKRARNHLQVVNPSRTDDAFLVEARLERLDEEGRVVAQLADGTTSAVMLGLAMSDQLIVEAVRARRAVLLGRLGAEGATRWVLLGTLRDRIGMGGASPATTEVPGSAVDGHLEVEAEDGITLGCGEASIELRADGRIALRGRDILVTSTGNATLQGAVVRVN